MVPMKKIMFSGIQPTGNIHIGNYLAAIRHWVETQADFNSIYSIVDLHAITIPQNPQVIKTKIREVAALLFAAAMKYKVDNTPLIILAGKEYGSGLQLDLNLKLEAMFQDTVKKIGTEIFFLNVGKGNNSKQY
jgi:hypothetical protein